jgi:sugar/nucleoside kinase (ribokinase family)
VEEIDPTGAGDCFGATFVVCWLRGMDPAQALSLAAASGALAVTKQGPMEGAASMGEIEAFLARSRAAASA